MSSEMGCVVITRVFRKYNNIGSDDISAISVNFVFHFQNDYLLCVEQTTNLICYYYHPQRSCGKVMFLRLSVILFTGGICPGACWDSPPGRHPPGHTPPGQTPLADNSQADNPSPRQTLPLTDILLGRHPRPDTP